MAKQSRRTARKRAVESPPQTDRLSERRARRSQGRQAAAAARRREKRIRNLALIVASALVLGIGTYFIASAIFAERPGEAVADAGRQHVEQGTTVTEYTSDPPTSGPHWPNTASWGVHDEPVPNELQVHNLEHGGIVIQYNDSVSPEVVDELEEIVGQCDVKLLLAPRPDMDTPIVVTAWERILRLDTFDRDQIQEFIDAYVNEGPEDIPSEIEAWEDCQ